MPRWVSRATIVIPAHEQHADRGVRGAPRIDRIECRWMAPLARVQKVPKEDDALCTRYRKKRVQPSERSRRGLLWHEDAGGAKGRGLAEVRIRDE